MKEIIAMIRPKMMAKTKDILEKAGIASMTVLPVLGRGKQQGIADEVNIEYRPQILELKNRKMKYIPKRMISMVVQDDETETVVNALVEVNRTGQIGDGKIFVCPIDDVLRIRTGEVGEAAVV
ncbi:MAG: P-II family nitrogen regulator [Planctomycetaceae bacterium]|jgi:nitrogen regulatory protein PII 2|nr:P-II family nitrogen regulator [Planctomycetaceae bacterium]